MSSSPSSPRAKRAASTPTSSTPRRASSSRSTAPAGVENPFFLALSPDKKFLYSIHAKQFGGQGERAGRGVPGRRPDRRAEVAQPAVGRGHRGVLPGRRQDREGRARGELLLGERGRRCRSRPTGRSAQPASFFQHKGSSVNPPAAEGAARPLHRRQPGQQVRLRGRPRDSTRSSATSSTRPTAKLTPNKPPFAKSPAGAGPRHLTFHPNGKRVYVINELLNSVTVFDYDADSGTLTRSRRSRRCRTTSRAPATAPT